MRLQVIHFLSGFWLAALLLVIASCSSGNDDVVEVHAGELMVSVAFKIPKASAEGYEEGEAYENYINVSDNKYRIYFFDNNNKFIDRLEGSKVVVSEDSDYQKYDVSGMASDGLVGYRSFKIVVLANWPAYDDSEMKRGVTTIDDICTSDFAQFDIFNASELKPDGKLIPFYGVQEYTNVEFKANELTVLAEPINLLRAVAKVEIVLEADKSYGLSFSEVKINRYNSKGYCAPYSVYSQSDYVHNSWDSDYVRNLHLVRGVNEEGEKEMSFVRVDSCEADGKLKEKWITYLPEYRNVDVENYSYMTVKFRHQREDDSPYDINFARYTDGKADSSERLNIERNNLYRFKVNVTPLQFRVSVDKWEFGGKVHIDM